MKTRATKSTEVSHQWYLVDAAGQTLGRLASIIAQYLIGKHKANYAPNLDMGDNIVVINAAKIRVTGAKLSDKMYYHHSGYPGGIKEINLEKLLEKNPAKVLELAVKGMLPKNRLSGERLKRLKVFPGGEHAHAGQSPEKLEIKTGGSK